ncbi:MAG: sugar nucleotide-binding protein, partial [Verrucomicrobiota bacterium]
MIFILGGSGYVGQAFCQHLESKGLAYRSIARSDVNYSDESSLRAWLKKEKPEFIINCAGYTGKPKIDDAGEHCVSRNTACFVSFA